MQQMLPNKAGLLCWQNRSFQVSTETSFIVDKYSNSVVARVEEFAKKGKAITGPLFSRISPSSLVVAQTSVIHSLLSVTSVAPKSEQPLSNHVISKVSISMKQSLHNRPFSLFLLPRAAQLLHSHILLHIT